MRPYLRRLPRRELSLEAGLVVLLVAAAVAPGADVVEEAIEVADVDDEGVGVVVVIFQGAHDDFVGHVNVESAMDRILQKCRLPWQWQNVNKTGSDGVER